MEFEELASLREALEFDGAVSKVLCSLQLLSMYFIVFAGL